MVIEEAPSCIEFLECLILLKILCLLVSHCTSVLDYGLFSVILKSLFLLINNTRCQKAPDWFNKLHLVSLVFMIGLLELWSTGPYLNDPDSTITMKSSALKAMIYDVV
ncbi:hypothetical protein VNO78_28564 [Psophocarpus tetragonolobus]|uniref:Uncharacterized protein n=1 Tax=Psophocarpus tetragonolobus TaxID=3891 RepID=A0AAN9RTX8_PSOTE